MSTPVGTWTVDPVHSSLTFSARMYGLSSFTGRFDAFSGSVTFSADGAHRAEGAVQTTSIDTAMPMRDDYLRAPESFDAAGHPEITLTTDELSLHDDEVAVRGQLTMRGRTVPITLDGPLTGPRVDDERGEERLGLELVGEVSLDAFGIGGLPAIDDGVAIRLGLQVVRADAA